MSVHNLFLRLVFLTIFMAIILGTLNINGCRNAKKRAALLEYIRLKQSSVVFLQECHSDQDNQPQWEMEWKGPVFFSHCSSVSAGVATLSPGLPWQGMSHVSIIIRTPT